MNTRNNTGLYRVTRAKEPRLSKGYRFIYQSHTGLLNVYMASADLLTLKMKVINNGLYWGILNKELAIRTANEEGINPLELNSNLPDKYVNIRITLEDVIRNENQYGNELYLPIGIENKDQSGNETRIIVRNETGNETNSGNELEMNSREVIL